jgi:membrane protein YqaA with SNARE-associated domain
MLIFFDSFKGNFIFSLSLETIWFAAKEFGTYNLFAISAVAFLGAVLAMCTTYLLGYALAPVINKLFIIEEDMHKKLYDGFNKYAIYALFFQMMPVVKLLFLFAGLLRLPFRRVLLFMVAGRAFYYTYYIYILPMIPSYHAM